MASKTAAPYHRAGAMRPLALIAAVVVLATDILYIQLTWNQRAEMDTPWVVPFVAGYLLLMAAWAAIAANTAREPWRTFILGGSAAGLLILGFLAAFSIGLLLLLAGGLMLVALIRTLRLSASRRAIFPAIAGALLALVILIAGFAASYRIIVCRKGVQSGSGSGFLTPSYSYTCQNGKAIVTWGR